VDLNQPPLGSGTVTLDGGGVIRGRVYQGVDSEGQPYWQVLTSPVEEDGFYIRYVGSVVSISDIDTLNTPAGAVNPYLETLDRTRKALGQKSDS